MSLILLAISHTPYTLRLTLEVDGKKKNISILKEDGESVDLPICPSPISEEIYQELMALEEREKLVKKALSYLEKRPYSKKGLYAKLIEKGAAPPEAKFAVLAVARYGYFHEKEDIGRVLFQMAETGHGPKKAKRYLLQKG